MYFKVMFYIYTIKVLHTWLHYITNKLRKQNKIKKQSMHTFKEFLQTLGPMSVLFTVCSLVPNQSTFHIVNRRAGAETQT
jgi:hypothetical protein